MKWNSPNSPPKPVRAGLALFGLVVALSAGVAHAGGTPSGTTISNTATLTYSVGAVPQSPIGSSQAGNSSGAGTATTFVVDKKVNLTVTTTDATFVSVVPGATAQVTTFVVINTGNDPQDFSLASLQKATGAQTVFGSPAADNFDATGCSQFVESNVVPNGYQVATDTATFIASLAADASKTVYVVCSIPAGQVNGDIAVVALTATARVAGSGGATALVNSFGSANTAGVDNVFADGAGSDDIALDASFSSRDAYRVVSAALSVAKTATLICDPFNGTTNPKNIPGSIVRWTITIANTSGASASLTTVTDAIAVQTTFDVNLVATTTAVCTSAGGTPENAAGRGFRVQSSVGARPLGGTAGYFTSATDADGADLAAGVVTVNYGTALPAGGAYFAGELKPGESVIVYFNVTVN